MYREDLQLIRGLDSYYYDDSDDEEQEQDIEDQEDIEPDWQRALNDYEHSFEKY